MATRTIEQQAAREALLEAQRQYFEDKNFRDRVNARVDGVRTALTAPAVTDVTEATPHVRVLTDAEERAVFTAVAMVLSIDRLHLSGSVPGYVAGHGFGGHD